MSTIPVGREESEGVDNAPLHGTPSTILLWCEDNGFLERTMNPVTGDWEWVQTEVEIGDLDIDCDMDHFAPDCAVPHGCYKAHAAWYQCGVPRCVLIAAAVLAILFVPDLDQPALHALRELGHLLELA